MDIKFSEGNDDYREAPGRDEWNNHFGLGGDDTIRIYQGTIIGGRGNDRIERIVSADWWRGVQAAYWDSPAPIAADLAAGWADDGYGGRDTLVNVRDLSFGWFGGSAAGNAENNTFYLGGGGAHQADGRGGDDIVFLPAWDNQPDLAAFTITVAIDGKSATVTASQHPEFTAVLSNVERIGVAGQWDVSHELGDFIKPLDMATQGLLAADGNRWNAGAALGTAAALSFSFVEQAPASGAGAAGFRPFTPEERAAVRTILQSAANAAGLSFTEVGEAAGQQGQLRFGASAQSATKGVSTLPGASGDAAGDVWIDLDTLALLAPGQEGYAVLLHEIGHALGLRHPRNVEAGDQYAQQFRAADDITALTVMSQTVSADGLFPAAWGALDIAALRHLYGVTALNAGDSVHRLGQAEFQSQRGLVDDGGSDTLDASAARTGATIDLTPGGLSSVGVTAAGIGASNNLSLGVDSWIEHAVGSEFDDVIIGNALANTLTGSKGNDWLDGGAGLDTASFAGRRGDYVLSSAFGKIFLTARDGSSGFDTLLNVEVLRFADASVTLAATARGADIELAVDQNSSLAGLLPDPSTQVRSQVSYKLLAGPANGSVTLAANGSYSYTPKANFSSADSFSYSISDAQGGSNSYLAYIAVRGTGGLQTGGESDDLLTGLAGADSISGEGGNDRIAGSAGYDNLNGGNGRDTVVYEGVKAGYTIAQEQDNWLVQKSAGQGADSLVQVERLLFSDGALALDLDGVAGQAYRLYQAAFDRQPDLAGLGYWLAQLDKGARMSDVAAAFLGSPEAQALYGSDPTPALLIARLYQNVLHREPDAEGLAYWNQVLGSGAITQAQTLASFADSLENHVQVSGAIAHGISYALYG